MKKEIFNLCNVFEEEVESVDHPDFILNYLKISKKLDHQEMFQTV